MKQYSLLVLVALLSGLVGGLIAPRDSVRAAEQETPFRARRFELVDREGRLVGAWGSQEDGRSTLTMYSRYGEALSIEIDPEGAARALMLGRDQKPRLLMGVDQFERPEIVLSDSSWEGRVHLGFIPPDTSPATGDNWGLLFRAPGSGRPLAGIGLRIKDGVRTPVLIPDVVRR